MKENRSLYFLKGIGCIAVIFIHVPFPGPGGKVIKQLCEAAVPVFLMVSGYYAYGITAEQALRRLKKTAAILLYGLIAFFLITIVPEIRNGSAAAWLEGFLTWKTLVRAVVFCTVDFAVPLWYLIAMCEGWALWTLVIRKKKERLAVRFMPVLTVARVALSIYCKSGDVDWFWEINFPATAMSWFLTGYLIRENEDRIMNRSDGALWAAAVSGALFSLIPIIFRTGMNFSSIGVIPYAVGMFLLAVKHPNRRISRSVEKIGKYLSPHVYILHCPWDVILLYLASKVTDPKGSWAWFHPLLVAACTVTASFLIRTCLDRMCGKKWGVF